MSFGSFIDPDSSVEDLEDPNIALGCNVFSGYQAMAHAQPQLGHNRIFDAIWQRSTANPLPCEDQCSPQYYFDIVRTLRDFNGEFDHVVEVGCYMGGATTVLAGCMERFDFTLDLVDIRAHHLRYSYERVRRLYPDTVANIRLFHGDLPSYVQSVMQPEPRARSLIHHDGAHAFNEVVRDLSALSFVRDQLFAIISQDTHLRGDMKQMNFVDMALYAVFGLDLNYAPIGAVYPQGDPVCEPNVYQGNYFHPGKPEGMVLPMACNRFHYPHPGMKLEDFLTA